jgi:hypothetical protein
MMKTKRILIWLLVIASGWLAACSSAAPSQPTEVAEQVIEATPAEPTAVPVPESPDPLMVVQNFYAALNAEDADAVAALLADDIRWRGTPYLTGKSSVMIYLESSMNGTWFNELSDMRVTRNRVTHTIASYRNDVIQFSGEETMVVEDGLITAVESYAGMGSDARPDPAEVAFTASDSGFSGPDEVAAGWVKISLTNEGQEGHHIQLVRVAEGKTPDDLKAALTADPESYPDWAEPFGGPNSPDPGGTTSAIVYLEMGSYVLVDLIPNSEGVPHFQNGLIKALTVTEPPSVMPGEPLPDVTINLSDFNFDVSGTFAAGEQTIRFWNGGSQPHETFLVKLAEGKTADDYLNTPPGEIPPGASLGGITGIVPGDSQYIVVNLEPGAYAIYCFLSDAATHTPHFALGMMQEFTVQE